MKGETRVRVLIPAFLLLSTSAYGEAYIGGQVGASFPNDVTNVEGTNSLAGFRVSDINLQNNLLYGAKAGYFFERAKWFGLETEVFNNTPHQKPQTVTVTGSGMTLPVSVPGTSLRVTTWAFNAIIRYPNQLVEPYAGVGLGVFFAHAGNESNTSVGLNALAGTRIFLTNRVAGFIEYKYQRASGEFAASIPGQGPAGLKGDYSANSIVAGVSYHFDAFR